MTPKQVRKFYCDAMNLDEKCSYLEYLNGNKTERLWITTVKERVNVLHQMYNTCQSEDGFTTCGGVIDYDELGNCSCGIGHHSHPVLEKKITSFFDLSLIESLGGLDI